MTKHTSYVPGESHMTRLKKPIISFTEIIGRKYPNLKSKGNLQVKSTEKSAVEVVEIPSAVNSGSTVKPEVSYNAKSSVEPKAEPNPQRQIQSLRQQKLKVRGTLKFWGK